MIDIREWTFAGSREQMVARSWSDHAIAPRFVAMLVHGYGEHIGRYDHVAGALIANGAVVYGVDHIGHGKSGGERVLITDFENVVDDVDAVVSTAVGELPGVPVVLIGHSMGGMIGARYAQRHGDRLAAVVLSGAAVGDFTLVEQLLALDEIPDIPLDPAILSRDPAVGEAYANDPLVWHGPFKRPLLQAMADTIGTIRANGSIGSLPLLWIHGVDDQLVPIEGTRAGMATLHGDTFRQHAYPGARHEVFNETNAAEVLSDVNAFIDDMLEQPTNPT
jgi:alpha-beta hydrolase superfamily lysophospholipase